MKKIGILSLLLCVVLFSFLLAGCGGGKTQIIGIFMPTENEPRWEQDSDSLMRQLQAKDYKVETYNARGDVAEQIRQIEAMIDKGCDILVIAAIDGSSLTEVLQKAADKKIKVIAYDRLIMDTANVDYYVTFDNYEVGRLQGEYIEKILNLKTSAGPFNIEIFAGALTDNNAFFFYNGAMSVLKPYIDSGKLIVKSGEVAMEVTTISEWLGSNAKIRMARLLNDHYADGTELHAILSPNDGLAIGIIGALKDFGFGGEGKPFPVLTGQDASIDNVKAIINGEQSMTVFKDTRTLANRTFLMIDALLLNKTPTTNNTTTYYNNIKYVPSYICKPVLVTEDNYKKELVDSGYYEMSQFE
ncbi:MAG: sugar-binding protein [Clostridiales bacterium]|nr:sugar-binding protein [Clostridiales bacterium]